MEPPIRVCLIEDDEDDYIVTRDLLSESRQVRFRLHWVETYADAVEELERGEHDVFLIDYALGPRTGLELLRLFARGAAPLIMLTGQDAHDVDLEAMRLGAMDYLVKGQIDAALLERSIRYSIARKRTEESLRRKDEFLAILGHELRNPLAPIRSALHLLDMPQATPATVQHAKNVLHRQVNHLVRLVDDLLDVSRIVLRRVELRSEIHDLMDIVRHAIETSAPVIESRGQELDLQPPAAALLVRADSARLTQALTNLLINAANHSDKPGTIRLTVAREGADAAVYIRDHGVGISADLLPRIFDLFVQGQRSLARSEGGLGIGLTLVKGIVELHGGTVSAASDGPGTGSEFVLRIPIASEPEQQPCASTDAALSGTPLHVLIVDDNIDAAETMAMMLEMCGHSVDRAHDGFAAVDVAERVHPDVILLDIGLPGRDGYEVARLLRGNPAFAKTHIIAVTGYGQPDDKRRAHEAGFNEHLTKPVDLERLITVLAQTRAPSR